VSRAHLASLVVVTMGCREADEGFDPDAGPDCPPPVMGDLRIDSLGFDAPPALGNQIVEALIESSDWLVVVADGRFATGSSLARESRPGCVGFSFEGGTPAEGLARSDDAGFRVPADDTIARLDLEIRSDTPGRLPLRDVTLEGEWRTGGTAAVGEIEAALTVDDARLATFGIFSTLTFCGVVSGDHGSHYRTDDDCLNVLACTVGEPTPDPAFDCANEDMPDRDVDGVPGWTIRGGFEAVPVEIID